MSIFKNLFKSKRKKNIEIIIELAEAMGMPEDAMRSLWEDLDMSGVTDEQINTIHKQLTDLRKECPPEVMKQWMQKAKEMQN